MTAAAAERARQVRQLFEAAVDLDPERRQRFLAEACGPDQALRAEVEGLLASLARVDTNELLPPLLGEAAAKEDAPALVGTLIHNYRVERFIAEGGMGSVFLARHTMFSREAALKVLHAPLARQDEMVQRFLNEARATNAIRHPNIIEVIDAGRLPGGAPYILMEYLPGESLGARLRRVGALPVPQALAIVRQIASALGAAHDKQIVHRDLKPENVFLVADETGNERVKVLDFGIAKLRADIAGTVSHTRSGALYGTPIYMSPEQCRNFSTVDRRTDVYALGVMLYEMLCGRPPFVAQSFGELIYMHLSQPPAPPRTRAPELPALLEAHILRALAKQPEQRFESMQAFAAALEDLATDAPAALPGGLPRRRLAALVGGVFAAGLAASVGFGLLRRSRSPAMHATPATAVERPTAPAPTQLAAPREVKPAPADGAPEQPLRKAGLRQRPLQKLLEENPYR